MGVNLVAWLVSFSILGCAPSISRGPIVENVDLRDLEGEPLRVEALRGRVVAISFVATWATLSLVDVKYLAALGERLGFQGLVVVIAVTDREGASVAAPLKSAFKLASRVAVAGESVVSGGTVFGRVSAVPLTVLVDRKGRIVFRTAAPLARGEFERLVDRLVREEP